MFDKFLEILKDLLPRPDLPNPVWITRLLSVSCVSLLFVIVINFILQGTPLGDRLGVSKPRSILPTLSQTELIYSIRETFNEFSKFRNSDPAEIQSSFLTFIVRKKDGNLVSDSTVSDKRVYPLIWVWNVPSTNQSVSLRLIEDSFASSIEKYREIFAENKKGEARYCLFNPINAESLILLKRAINGFSSNYVVSCALYDKNDIPIGATIAYIKLKPNLPLEKYREYLYPLMDRLRITTDTIEPKFNDMTVNYQFLYNSKP